MSGSSSTWRALEGFRASSAWRSLTPQGSLRSLPPGGITGCWTSSPSRRGSSHKFQWGYHSPKRNNLLEPPALRALDFSRVGVARLALFSGLTLKVSDMTSSLCRGSGSSSPSRVAASGGTTRPSQLLSVPTVTLSLLKGAERTRTPYLVPVRSKPSHGRKTPQRHW